MAQVQEISSRKIIVLPEEVVNRIAAGEVVERPASVVKELMENSLDAGSDQILVWVKDGGKSLIRITDNGTGMSEDDALLSFERHATSKIRIADDLDAIASLGFRGEALSSIAAVSMVEMKAGLKSSTTGSFIRVEAGHIEEVRKIAWNGGTSVTVRNLFYNTPGRRKFLRTNSTEMRHIVHIFKQYALCHPEKTFSLYHGDQPVWELGKTLLPQRIQEAFTESFFDLLIDLDVALNGLKIKGFIGKPELVRSWMGEQYLYLNNRCIRNRSLKNAIQTAYGTTIEKGGAPFFILFLEIDPGEVDVNVHPSKWEVRFRNEREIYVALSEAIRQRLSTGSTRISSFSGDRFQPFSQIPATSKPMPYAPVERNELYPSHKNTPLFDELPVEQPRQERTKWQAGVERGKIWQVHNKYIISQVKTGIIVIDQHAAHERILYERTKEIMETRGGISQHLIFPEILELSADDMLIIQEVLPYLEKIGFSLNIFSNNSLVVEAVPAELRKGREKEFIKNFLNTYREDEMKELDVYDRIASSFACHAAIKTGDVLTYEEMTALIDELFATKFPYYCPHGRPVVIQMSLDELDKKFLR